jgi:hypothetical protein
MGVGLEKEGDEESFDLTSATDDLLVTAARIGTDGGEFPTIEGTLAGQRLTAIARALTGFAGGVAFADDGGQQGIVAEIVVIVEIFVSQGQAIDALSDELLKGVFDELGIAMVGETTGKLADDAGEFFDLPQQQGAAVGGDAATVKVGAHLTRAEAGKVEDG